MSERLKEMADRHEKLMRDFAMELLKTTGHYRLPRYLAPPGASLWVRLRVWLKNKLDR